MIQKPKFGSPCNGCGLCCQLERCAIAVKALGEGPGPCPGLVWREGRSSCLMVEEADRMGPEYSGMIRYRMGIGLGCDSEVDGVDFKEEAATNFSAHDSRESPDVSGRSPSELYAADQQEG
jgi:hypothetical protein